MGQQQVLHALAKAGRLQIQAHAHFGPSDKSDQASVCRILLRVHSVRERSGLLLGQQRDVPMRT